MKNTVKNRAAIAVLSVIAVFLFVSTGWANEYYVDYTAGNDSNYGTSAATPWKHSPGDAKAASIAASAVLSAGDAVYFKKGVTYVGQITNRRSGAAVSSGTTGSIPRVGVFVDNRASFGADGVASGDYLYIYNNSTSGSWVNSMGLWTIASVDSNTQITLNGSAKDLHSTGEMAYRIFRPVTYTSTASFGSGKATITGSGTRDYIFNVNGQNFIRIANLELINLRDVPADGCSNPKSQGAIYSSGTVDTLVVENVNFSNVWSGLRADSLRYSVVRNNTVDGFGFIGLSAGKYGLLENNTLTDGTSGIRSGAEYTVIRFNTLTQLNHPAANYCGYHSDGIGPFFSSSSSPGSNKYGWIYGNLISNTVKGIFLEYNNGGTSNWTIHSNVLIGHSGAGGSGTTGIAVNSAPNTKVYGNTIFGINGSAGWINAIEVIERAGQGGSTNVELKNNILYSLNSSAGGVKVDGASQPGFVAEGNLYYTPSRSNLFKWGSTLLTWSQWTARGNDTAGNSSFGTDPLFIDTVGTTAAALNLRLQPRSTALNSPYSLSVDTRDRDLNVRSKLTNWDRGAYEQDVIAPLPPQIIN